MEAAVRAVRFGDGGEQVLERAADGGQGDQARRGGALFFAAGWILARRVSRARKPKASITSVA